MLTEMLNERNLPPLLSRDEMLDILQREIYGKLPEKPEAISFDTEVDTVANFCAGKAVLNKVTAHCVIRGKEFSSRSMPQCPLTERNIRSSFISISGTRSPTAISPRKN